MTIRFYVLVLLAFLMGGCASSGGLDGDLNDPFEDWNRSVFEFNTAVDQKILKPVISGYKKVTPKPVQDGLRNFTANLGQPFIFLNSLLQGKFDKAGDTLGRFLVNSTLGLGGFFDVASDLDVPAHREDFGQTLAVWGFESGPYLVLPFLGPSNVRDTGGFAAGIFADPVTVTLNGVNQSDWNWVNFGASTFQGIVAVRPTLDALYQEKDPYAFARTAYRQARAFAICDGRCTPKAGEGDLFDDFDDYDDFDDDPDRGPDGEPDGGPDDDTDGGDNQSDDQN